MFVHNASQGNMPTLRKILPVLFLCVGSPLDGGGLKNLEHWAFQPLGRVEAPPAIGTESTHPIDRFAARARRARALVPVASATPRVLLRRLYFDLVGLPPSREAIQDFERHATRNSRTAIEAVIDRLLASPRYGERWGRHWMDVVRYADTAGDNADYPVPEARRYRDYIIDAFNRDMPFDQFIREQVAGDIIAQKLPDDRYADLISATGFLALSRRYGTGPYELWHLTLEDTIDTVGRAFLGLTLRCARCHDHKFDPITTADYYALYGVFDSTQFPWAGAEEFISKRFPRRHFVPLVPDHAAAGRLTRYKERLAASSAKLAQLEDRIARANEDETPRLRGQLEALKTAHERLARPGLPDDLPGAYAVREGKPHDAAVHLSGKPAERGDTIPRGAISFLCPEPLAIPADESGRLQLAEWMTSRDHPLTARVVVNRIWQQHFGRGLVATPSNFGLSGASPTHPELLDFLTRRFLENSWSIKSLHRLILTSKTWQLSSAEYTDNLRIDTGNEYYWRHDRRRLDAESIRDAMLVVSGTLSLDRPGPHPFPPIEKWNWTQHRQFKERYETAHRSVYLMTQRLQRHPFLALFDSPDTNTSTGKRTTSTVTPQSLYLMNSPDMVQAAGAFAERLLAAAHSTRARLSLAYWSCFGRPPANEELARDTEYLNAAQASLAGDPAIDGERAVWLSYSRVLLSSGEFFYLD